MHASEQIRNADALMRAGRADAGNRLYVDDAGDCEGMTPCYETLGSAVFDAAHGDTILVLPGIYAGAEIDQRYDLGSLRIVSRDGDRRTPSSRGTASLFGVTST